MSSHTPDYLNDKLTVARVVTYVIAFLITFTFVDFFQVKATAQHGSFDHFNRHFAKTYPGCIPRGIGDLVECAFGWTPVDEPDTRSDPMVSVVLWTDAMLKAASMSWPIRMEDHARVLETLLPLQPRGVLVDLFFLDNPESRGDESLQDLVDALCDYQDPSPGETATIVYLTEPGPEIDPLTTVTLLDGLRDTCGLNLAEPGPTDNVRLVPADLTSAPTRVYSKDGAAARVFSPDAELEDFHLFWAQNPNQPFLDKHQCMAADARFPNNMLEVLVDIALRTTTSTSAAPCPYAPVFSAHVMRCLRAAPVNDTYAAGLRELENCGLTRDEYSVIQRTIKDKYVLYGTELHGLGDLYDVPIHEGHRLSGIFIHAMALDNLLETDGNVHYVKGKRARFPSALYYILSALLATLVFLVIKFAFFDLWHCIVKCAHDPKSLMGRFAWLVLEFAFWVLAVISAAAALMFVAWISYLLGFLYEPFRFGILNWLGILLVSGLLSVWVKIPFAFELAGILEQSCKKLCAAMGCRKSSTERVTSGPEGTGGGADRPPAG
ncbi:MAG: CHASE2 domain-containing protein [Gammaproteobacteria bacterium]|nr:CHASE2 domain-containing protein [Gammaproteobacteria bacterium]